MNSRGYLGHLHIFSRICPKKKYIIVASTRISVESAMHPCVLSVRCESNVSNKSQRNRQRMPCHAYKASLILITFNPISPTIYSAHEELCKQDTPSVSFSCVSPLYIPPSISNPRISSDHNGTATSQIMTIVTARRRSQSRK